MATWIDTLLQQGQDAWSDADWGRIASFAGAYVLGNDKFLPEGLNEPVGWQGQVSKITPVRERVPQRNQPNRRPGEAGRSYFSDTEFLTDPFAMSGVQGVDPTGTLIDDPATTNVNEATRELTMVEDARNRARAQANRRGAAPPQSGIVEPNALPMARGGQVQAGRDGRYAAGGITQLEGGARYLNGMTDGMADEVPANIDGTQEAALSDGEFVIPADVVSHLGNGSSNAGAGILRDMMGSVRKERTGNSKQGKEIDARQVLAKGGIATYANGGAVKKFAEGDAVSGDQTDETTTPAPETDPLVGLETGTESSLSTWAAPYVSDFLGKAWGLSEQPYEAYTGPLTAGASDVQQKAFQGVGSLNIPTDQMGAFTPGTFDASAASQYMNPYMMGALNPQIAEARRQSEIDRIANAGRMTAAGSFGGSRQALMDSENQRNLQRNVADITAEGYNTAYQNARDQFNTEQTAGQTARDFANKYGLEALQLQRDVGDIQRGITSEGIAADKAQFEEERDFQYKMPQWLHSLTQGLPLTAQSTSYSEPSAASQFLGNADAFQSLMSAFFPSGDGGTTTNDSGSGT